MMRDKLIYLTMAVFCLAWPLWASATATATPATSPQASLSSTTHITGKVIDANGDAVIGASVIEKGTQNGTATDVDGTFALDVRRGADLVISFIGYQTMEVAAHSGMVVTMTENTNALDELVVVGYGVQKKNW